MAFGRYRERPTAGQGATLSTNVIPQMALKCSVPTSTTVAVVQSTTTVLLKQTPPDERDDDKVSCGGAAPINTELHGGLP